MMLKERVEAERTADAAAGGTVRPALDKPAVVVGFLLGVFFLILSFVPLRQAVEIGADEGFELAKATLCLKGYRLYRDVWCDHPPVHTFLLTQVLRHVSPSVAGPRLISVGFAALLLVSVFFIALRAIPGTEATATWTSQPRGAGVPVRAGEGASLRQAGSAVLLAGLAMALLLASPGFVELSASCMMEIPALAPAVAALAVLLWGRQNKWHWWEVLAGVLFGIGLGMKLLGAMLLPLAALILWLRQREAESGEGRGQSALHRRGSCHQSSCQPGNRSDATDAEAEDDRRTGDRKMQASAESSSCHQSSGQHSLLAWLFPPGLIRSGLIFGASLAVTFVALDLVIDRGDFLRHFQQTWASHFTRAVTFEYGSPEEHRFPPVLLLRNWDVTVPAILGVVVLLRRSRQWPLALVPVAWLALALVVIGTHTPWWVHYYVHIAIPLCLCAAVGYLSVCSAVASKLKEPGPGKGAGSRRRQAGRAGPWKRQGSDHFVPPVSQWRQAGSAVLRVGRAAPVLLFVLCAGAWMVGRVYVQVAGIRSAPQTHYALVLEEIRRYKPFTEWLYADNLTYSFHTGIPLPPQLAVVSLKRLWSGELTLAGVAAEVRRFKPGVIALRNDTRELPFQDLLDAEYRLVYRDAENRLYAHRSIANKPAL